MLNGILGKKVGMTHIYVDDKQIPVTVIEAGPAHVVQKKTVQKDGYEALQVGYGEKTAPRTNKPMAGHFKKAGTVSLYHIKEFSAEDIDSINVGQAVGCGEVFKTGDFVDVTATSKGKGFAGVIKRWGFHGGPGGHGSKHGRAGGSVGQGSDPSKVFKGIGMPGQMGNKKATIQNVEVVGVKPEANILLLKGGVPGSVGTIITIKKALKK